ncbi:MAG: hypothetical protein ACK5P7_00790 [Bdellovibrio sp.]
MTRHLLVVSMILSLCGLSACSKDDGEKKDPKPGGLTTQQSKPASTLTVLDQTGAPLAGAKVLIGPELGKPFAGNFLTTDAAGKFVAPADWSDAQPITIQGTGHIRVTYLAQSPSGQKFKLRGREGSGTYQLGGTTSGFNVVDRDGVADFAIVIPAFSRADLFSFDVSKVISSQNDSITVVGQTVEIPSNISLPRQRESYFLPVTLEKPEFRMYFRTTGIKKVVTLRGQFPFKQVVDELRGSQDFLSLINLFNIQGGSVKNVNVSSGGSRETLPVNEMNFSNSRRMTAPNFKNDEVVIASSMNPKDGMLYPSDFKNLTARQNQALQVVATDAILLTVAKRKAETQEATYNDRISSAIQPFASGALPELLPLIENPRLLASHTIQIPSTKPVGTIIPVATYATLSRVSTKSVGTDAIESLTTEWEVFADNWVRDVALPKWPKTPAPNDGGDEESTEPLAGQMRWGVTLLGQSPIASGSAELGPDLLETATHATHSSLDF